MGSRGGSRGQTVPLIAQEMCLLHLTILICRLILTILIKILQKTMNLAFWISFQNAFFYVSQNVLPPVIQKLHKFGHLGKK